MANSYWPGYFERRAELSRLFCEEGQEDRDADGWATLESLAPGTIERLPPDLQELILQHCLIAVEMQLGDRFLGHAPFEVPCRVHSLWAVLYRTAPAAWGGNGFRGVGRRERHELPRWCSTTADATKTHWQMLAEIGRCCPDKQKSALEALRCRGAPLDSLLINMDLWYGDSLRPGEKRLLSSLLEHTSTGTIVEAQTRWAAHCESPTEWNVRAWAGAVDKAEQIFRWRGLRAAWVSAVLRATLRRP